MRDVVASLASKHLEGVETGCETVRTKRFGSSIGGGVTSDGPIFCSLEDASPGRLASLRGPWGPTMLR